MLLYSLLLQVLVTSHSLVPKAAVKGWSLGGMLSFCFLYPAQVLFLGYDQSIRKHLTVDLLNYHSGRSVALPAEVAIHTFPDVASYQVTSMGLFRERFIP